MQKYDATFALFVLYITFYCFCFIFEIIKLVICLKLSHFSIVLIFLSVNFHDIILSGEFFSIIGSYLANYALPHFPCDVGALKCIFHFFLFQF